MNLVSRRVLTWSLCLVALALAVPAHAARTTADAHTRRANREVTIMSLCQANQGDVSSPKPGS